MQKIHIIISSIAVIGLCIVGVVVLSQTDDKNTENKENKTVTTNTNNTSEKTMRELIASGDAVTCEFRQKTEEDIDVEGTIYMSAAGQELSGVYTVMYPDGREMQTNIVRKGNTNYVWGDQFEQGIKTTVQAEDLEQLFPETNEDDVYIDSDVTYTCESWKVDETVFTLPNDVNFMDMSAFMQPAVSMSSTVSNEAGVQQAQLCGACDMIGDETQRAQCESALGC